MTLDNILIELENKFPNHKIINDLERRFNLVKWIKSMFDSNHEIYDACMAKRLMLISLEYIDDTKDLLLLSEINLRGLCQGCDEECDKNINDKILDKAYSVLAN